MTPACCRGLLEVFDVDGGLVKRFYSIEKPWIPHENGGRAGMPFRSCIGPGIYDLSNYMRPNGDKVWRLVNPDLDVFPFEADIPAARSGKGRFLILIHIANRAYDVVGCIGPGRSWRTEANGGLMVTNSRDAIQDLHRVLDGRRRLEIEVIESRG